MRSQLQLLESAPVADAATQRSMPKHGGSQLPSVTVDAYNCELEDAEGFVGDRACKGAFRRLIESWRKPLRRAGEDPLGDEPSETLSKKQLDEVLLEGDPEAAAVVQSAIEDFAQQLSAVIQRYLKLKAWKGTESIVVGGGLRDSRVGEIAIGRTSVLLKAAGLKIAIEPIEHHPDEAGLLGAAHLVPRWMLEGHDAILAVDIGGTNIRAGVVLLNLKKAADLSKAEVWKSELWRHGEEKEVGRDEAIAKLVAMLEGLLRRASKEKLRLAPFVGVGCPGVIEEDGTIERGAQNLPGKWEGRQFNLPRVLQEAIPSIAEHDTLVLLHNDAVVQGLSAIPAMAEIERWAVLTIGTGLGNAHFTNRTAE